MLLFALSSVACAVTWAVSSVIFARALTRVEGASAPALNLVKCALAFPPLVVVGLLQGEGLPRTAGQGPALFLSAALGLAVSDTAYFFALALLGVARAVLFIPLVPLVTAALAAAFLGDPFGAVDVAGMTLVLAGLVLVIARADDTATATATADDATDRRRRLVGVLAGVGSAIAQGAANVLMKTAVVAGSATHVAALRIGFGAVVLAVVVAFTGGARTVRPFLSRGVFGPIFVASFVGTFLGMWLGTWGAKGLPIGIATTLAATTPVWALVLARFTGERVTGRAVVGAVIAIAGVVVLASSTSR
jgi:drug/metabolite transporter (DMT)-like permease